MIFTGQTTIPESLQEVTEKARIAVAEVHMEREKLDGQGRLDPQAKMAHAAEVSDMVTPMTAGLTHNGKDREYMAASGLLPFVANHLVVTANDVMWQLHEKATGVDALFSAPTGGCLTKVALEIKAVRTSGRTFSKSIVFNLDRIDDRVGTPVDGQLGNVSKSSLMQVAEGEFSEHWMAFPHHLAHVSAKPLWTIVVKDVDELTRLVAPDMRKKADEVRAARQRREEENAARRRAGEPEDHTPVHDMGSILVCHAYRASSATLAQLDGALVKTAIETGRLRINRKEDQWLRDGLLALATPEDASLLRALFRLSGPPTVRSARSIGAAAKAVLETPKSPTAADLLGVAPGDAAGRAAYFDTATQPRGQGPALITSGATLMDYRGPTGRRIHQTPIVVPPSTARRIAAACGGQNDTLNGALIALAEYGLAELERHKSTLIVRNAIDPHRADRFAAGRTVIPSRARAANRVVSAAPVAPVSSSITDLLSVAPGDATDRAAYFDTHTQPRGNGPALITSGATLMTYRNTAGRRIHRPQMVVPPSTKQRITAACGGQIDTLNGALIALAEYGLAELERHKSTLIVRNAIDPHRAARLAARRAVIPSRAGAVAACAPTENEPSPALHQAKRLRP